MIRHPPPAKKNGGCRTGCPISARAGANRIGSGDHEGHHGKLARRARTIITRLSVPVQQASAIADGDLEQRQPQQPGRAARPRWAASAKAANGGPDLGPMIGDGGSCLPIPVTPSSICEVLEAARDALLAARCASPSRPSVLDEERPAIRGGLHKGTIEGRLVATRKKLACLCIRLSAGRPGARR